ncbi:MULTISPECIES: DUF4190 domain-containing protein [Nocardioides]|uniref:DUF4190 domain-containing protein n=1 Tax=Nocardioides vastitatis TaxID=2568655 RepID=A0ABW0ZLX3_9ACTN|nr:DUF4190 domain-containing protein [Nocardioides sp.]THI93265.1 DUF4190 domain-containing protein [Nocardioides sp.]
MSDPYGNPYGQPYGQPNPYGAGGGGAYGAPPGGGFPNQQPKTDGVSVASFVLSLLCCTGLLGLILGFVGLSRTKGGKRKGRGFAIAGIVLGLLGTIALVATIIAVATGGLKGLLPTAVNDLKDGECITADGLAEDDGGVTNIKVVDCDQEHDGQVIGTKKLTSSEAADYDFESQEDILDSCTPMLDGGENALVADPQYYLIALTQQEKPSSGDQVACIITLRNGDPLDKKLP